MAFDKAGHDRRSVFTSPHLSPRKRGEGARRPLPAASPAMHVRSLSRAILVSGPRLAHPNAAVREALDREYLFAWPQARKTLAARRHRAGAIHTLREKKRVNPLCDDKPRSKPISLI